MSNEVPIMNKFSTRALIVLILLAMLLGVAAAARAEGSFKAVVTSKTMKVYSQAEPHSVIGKLSKGDTVTVKAYSGKAALISYNGNTGVAKISDMMAIAGNTQTEEVKVETATASEIANARTMVTVPRRRTVSP